MSRTAPAHCCQDSHTSSPVGTSQHADTTLRSRLIRVQRKKMNTSSSLLSSDGNSVSVFKEDDRYHSDLRTDSRRELLDSFVDIKSPVLRDCLRKVLDGVTCVNLREDKPSVRNHLRTRVASSSAEIFTRSILTFCSPIYRNWRYFCAVQCQIRLRERTSENWCNFSKRNMPLSATN